MDPLTGLTFLLEIESIQLVTFSFDIADNLLKALTCQQKSVHHYILCCYQVNYKLVAHKMMIPPCLPKKSHKIYHLALLCNQL